MANSIVAESSQRLRDRGEACKKDILNVLPATYKYEKPSMSVSFGFLLFAYARCLRKQLYGTARYSKQYYNLLGTKVDSNDWLRLTAPVLISPALPPISQPPTLSTRLSLTHHNDQPQTPSDDCNKSLLRKRSSPVIAQQDDGGSYTYKNHHQTKKFHQEYFQG